MDLTLNENHEYYLGNNRVPGVSEILSGLGMVDLFAVPTHVLEERRDFGREVHFVCEAEDKGILKKGTIDVAVEPHLNAWRKFTKDYKAVYVEIEKSLFSKKWWYAGTLDRIANINGKHYVIDIKTSKYLIPSVKIQTAFYKLLAEENGYKIAGRWIIQVSESGYKINDNKDKTDEGIAISAVNIFRWKSAHKLNEKEEYTKETFGF